MKSSLYLESTNEEQGYDGDHGLDQGGLSGMSGLSEPWMSPAEGSVSFPRLDGSPYTASLTPLHSPETPCLDQFFPPQMGGDFSHLTPLIGDYSPVLGHLPLPRPATSISEAYSLGSTAPSPYLHANVWPAHVSPTAFLPTPPTPADQYSSEEESSSSKKKRKTSKSSPKRPTTQLRTASRAPKKRSAINHRPAESTEEVKARAAHNQVEQQYRKRLNAYFEKLLAVLPEGEDGDRRLSKAEVLDLARRRIRALEKETGQLEKERRELRGRICGLERQIGRV